MGNTKREFSINRILNQFEMILTFQQCWMTIAECWTSTEFHLLGSTNWYLRSYEVFTKMSLLWAKQKKKLIFFPTLRIILDKARAQKFYRIWSFPMPYVWCNLDRNPSGKSSIFNKTSRSDFALMFYLTFSNMNFRLLVSWKILEFRIF